MYDDLELVSERWIMSFEQGFSFRIDDVKRIRCANTVIKFVLYDNETLVYYCSSNEEAKLVLAFIMKSINGKGDVNLDTFDI